jgi:hypothetical protein
MNTVISTAILESEPIEPEPCELCGCTADLEDLIYLRAADLIAEWERADPRDAWRHTGEQPPRMIEPVPTAVQPYRTPQATIDAFWYVASLDNPEYLTRWIAQHPSDASALYKLWEGKHARA